MKTAIDTGSRSPLRHRSPREIPKPPHVRGPARCAFAGLAILFASMAAGPAGDPGIPAPAAADGKVDTGGGTPPDAFAGYFWVLPSARRESLSRAIEACKLGDDLAAVIARTGKPDQDELGDANQLIPRRHNHRVISFAVARFRKDLVTEGKDQWVDLWFTSDNKLEVVSSAFPAVKERSSRDAWDRSPMPGWWKIWMPEGERSGTTRPTTRPATAPSEDRAS